MHLQQAKIDCIFAQSFVSSAVHRICLASLVSVAADAAVTRYPTKINIEKRTASHLLN